ncbi:MAG: T9SS type A sorting domain-containing protein [Gemmatimonadetes bacterium]|nr:T9SS type A sorting domain-containing protein [Gemmatimonadota bacterium]
MGFLFTKGVGDLNGDGTTDLLAADLTDTANGTGAGRIYLMSGVDRSMLHDIKGAPGDAFGVARGVGDIDGDGCDDVVASAFQNDDVALNAGKVSILSGKTGLALRTITCNLEGDGLGYSVVGVGDVSGDGVPDFMVSANRHDTGDVDAGIVYLISGAIPTGVDQGSLDGHGDSRAGFALRSIRPNPASGPATIQFSLPVATDIDLSVYDVRGRLVQKLRAGATAPGEHTVAWDGQTRTGARASSGIYFFKLRSSRFEATRKLILNR